MSSSEHVCWNELSSVLKYDITTIVATIISTIKLWYYLIIVSYKDILKGLHIIIIITYYYDKISAS